MKLLILILTIEDEAYELLDIERSSLVTPSILKDETQIPIMPEVVEHILKTQTESSAVPSTVMPDDTELTITELPPCVPAPAPRVHHKF
ncbi:hypothetical protein EVAR_91698_1 [Eumeta japonica]|uniref:Uncharacterized protein n=1 Tax=Eumeta variegata TaxID=151549 RepID=A0A4C1ZGQ8_EUMVA|nr:hypothetical protein EVAR_91698_1 [Eumeta japonica]